MFAQRRMEKIILQAQNEPTPEWLETCPVRLKNKLKQAHWYPKSDSQLKPKQAHRCAKSSSQICQIRLKIMPNQAKNKPIQAHMPHKCAQPGIQGQIKTKKTNKTKQKKFLVKSKMAAKMATIVGDVTSLPQRHHPWNIPHLVKKIKGFLLKVKSLSKYCCSISKTLTPTPKP